MADTILNPIFDPEEMETQAATLKYLVSEEMPRQPGMYIVEVYSV